MLSYWCLLKCRLSLCVFFPLLDCFCCVLLVCSSNSFPSWLGFFCKVDIFCSLVFSTMLVFLGAICDLFLNVTLFFVRLKLFLMVIISCMIYLLAFYIHLYVYDDFFWDFLGKKKGLKDKTKKSKEKREKN